MLDLIMMTQINMIPQNILNFYASIYSLDINGLSDFLYTIQLYLTENLAYFQGFCQNWKHVMECIGQSRTDMVMLLSRKWSGSAILLKTEIKCG